MLTIKQIEAFKPRDRQYKNADGHGLYLMVSPRNIKSWRYDYKVDDKWNTKTYGTYPEVSLAKARLLHVEFREFIAKGGEEKTAPTFNEVFQKWYQLQSKRLTNDKNIILTFNRYDTYIKPYIGDKPIDTIKRVNLIEIVKAIDMDNKRETAYRIGVMIRQIFNYAVDMGEIENHPAEGLSRVLSSGGNKQHMKCVSIEEVGELLRRIDEYDEVVTKNALKVMSYTFLRTQELLGLKWSEMTKDGYLVIPAERTKKDKPHVVPMSMQVKLLLNEMRGISSCDLIFESPAKRGHKLSENTLLFALYRLGYRGKMTVHGFRALASTALNMLSPYKQDVIERQLAHKEKDAVRIAYNRAEHIEERTEMMQWYANWLDAQIKKDV